MTGTDHEHEWRLAWGDTEGARGYDCAVPGCPAEMTAGPPVPPLDPALVTVVRKTIEGALREYDEATGELVAMPDDDALGVAARAVIARLLRGAP